MEIKLKFNRGLQVKVWLSMEEYEAGLKAVPLEGQVQGLEHSGRLHEVVARLARMMEALDNRSKSKKAKLYRTMTCPYSKMAAEHLKGLGVDVTHAFVENDDKLAQEMIEKSGQMGVPVLVAGEEVVVGFDKQRYDELFKD